MAITGDTIISGKAREATISAVITRADGTVEYLGNIAYWHANPLKRWAFEFKRWIREKFK